jgi:amino acid transporter
MLQGMSREPLGGPFRHGLTFIATLAFVASFFGSRLFATAFPTTVVTQGGIHLHHFWYGLGLIAAAGWMGIAWRNERLYRLYAVLYGLGAGFVGDEVGLLLTFNNYQSELTYLFFIAAISFVIIATLFLRYRAQLKDELLKLTFLERLAMIGVFLTGFSVFFFFLSSGISLVGIPLSLCGLAILVWVYVWRRKPRAIQHAKQD